VLVGHAGVRAIASGDNSAALRLDFLPEGALLHPGDEVGEGLVRHCTFPVPRFLGSGGGWPQQPSKYEIDTVSYVNTLLHTFNPTLYGEVTVGVNWSHQYTSALDQAAKRRPLEDVAGVGRRGVRAPADAARVAVL